MELQKSDGAAPGEFDERSENHDSETDLPPEYVRYRDEGCDLAESCLNCPFEECVYDRPGGKQRWLKKLRAGEMVNLFTNEGKPVKELARIFGVSQRTVQRTLKAALGNSNRRGVKNG